MKETVEWTIMPQPRLQGFLSDHDSKAKIISIQTEPEIIYFEETQDGINLNFDFIIKGLTKKKLVIRFIKVAVYDMEDKLITFRHLNHNGVWTPGIQTIGKYEVDGEEIFDIYNPFHKFPKGMPINYLRYMFTFSELDNRKEYYYGNIVVKPKKFHQKVKLTIPLKGLITILDGHDYYSHHRRFGMTFVRKITNNSFTSNFSRYAVDFTLLGSDGNTRKMKPDEYSENHDFHFKDIKKFYTHNAVVYAPADGEIVDAVGHLEDLYETLFDMDNAIQEKQVEEIAGNYIIIKHTTREFSHLFHLLKGSIEVAVGDKVLRGQPIAKVGFSGAATTYSHLHYQLLDGMDFLKDNPLPFKFSEVLLVKGSKQVRCSECSVDTGDFVYQK